MRLGIGSYSLAWNIGVAGAMPDKPLDHLGLLNEAVRLGVRRVQYCDNLCLDKLTLAELDHLIAIAEAHGIVIEPGTRGIDEQRLRRLAEIAQRTGCGFVRVVIDQKDDEPTPDEAVERMRFWRDAVPGSIRLAVENHDRFPAETLRSMIERLGPDRYGVCLDTANSLGALEGTEHVVQTLSPHTVNLHVKDIVIRRAWHMMGFEVSGTAAGEGMLDIPALLEAVRPTAESAIVEIWAKPDQPGEPPLEKEKEMLERSISFMRRLLP